jgi:hypothetical protein
MQLCALAHSASNQTNEGLAKDLLALDRLRRGRETPFDEVDQRATEMLKKYPKPEDQGRIYFGLVQVYGQSAGSPQRIIDCTKKALQFPLDPLQRMRLYTYWGNAVLRLTPLKALPERRREATSVFLDALTQLRKLDLPEKAPEIPTMDAGIFVPATEAEAREMEEKNRRDMAALETAELLREMIRRRDILTEEIVWLYSREPHATNELRELAIKTTMDSELTNGLVQMIERRIKEMKQQAVSPGKKSKKTAVDVPKQRALPRNDGERKAQKESKRELSPTKDDKVKPGNDPNDRGSSVSRYYYLAAGFVVLVLMFVVVLRRS